MVAVMLCRAFMLFALSVCTVAGAAEIQSGRVARWIAVDSSSQQVFSRSFTVDRPVQNARLRATGLSTNLRIEIDENVIASINAYDPLLDRDLSIRSGRNRHEIRITADPIEGPSVFFVQLDLTLADGSRHSIVTDSDWLDTDGQDHDPREDRTLGEVERSLLVPAARRARIQPVDNYEQWKLAGGDQAQDHPVKFDLLPGFQIERIRQAGADEDSRVSMVFDPQGRLVIGKE